jgi:phage shock protein C
MNSLYRSPNDRVFAGVAGGMAETYGLDPALVRVGWALLTVASGGIFLVVYVVMALVVPLRPHTANLWATAGGGTSSGPGMPGWGQQTSPPGPEPTGYAPTGWSGNRAGHNERGTNVGPIVIGLILIIVGGFFLARQFIPALDFGLIWPVVAIVGGLLLIAAAFVRQRPGS